MTLPMAQIYHHDEGLMDIAGFGGVSSHNNMYYHMSRPFNPQQQNRDFSKEENMSLHSSSYDTYSCGPSVTSNCNASWDGVSYPPLQNDNSSVVSSCAALKRQTQKRLSESDHTVATHMYDDWSDECSACDAIYDAVPCPSPLPTPSSHLPIHPSSASSHGESQIDSLASLEATEFDEDTPENLDDLERRIADLSLEIATMKGEVDICQFQCRKLTNEKDRELMRSEELEQENESLRKTIEEMERQALIEAMEATRGKTVTEVEKPITSKKNKQMPKGFLLTLHHVSFSDYDDDNEELDRYYITDDSNNVTTEETKVTDLVESTEHNKGRTLGALLSQALNVGRLFNGSGATPCA